MFEPFSAIMAMQAAIAGIRSCAEMLSEGKSEVQRIKKAVADAKEIAAEIGGFFSWVKGLLGITPKGPLTASPVASTPEPKAKAKPKDEWIEHIPDENEIVDQFVRHLSEFLRQQAALVEYIDERKRLIFEGKVSENAHEAALELVMLEHRIEIFGAELREMMTINAPQKRSPWFTFAGIVLQIGIVLSTAAILAVAMPLFYASVGVGSAGALLFLFAMFGA